MYLWVTPRPSRYHRHLKICRRCHIWSGFWNLGLQVRLPAQVLPRLDFVIFCLASRIWLSGLLVFTGRALFCRLTTNDETPRGAKKRGRKRTASSEARENSASHSTVAWSAARSSSSSSKVDDRNDSSEASAVLLSIIGVRLARKSCCRVRCDLL